MPVMTNPTQDEIKEVIKTGIVYGQFHPKPWIEVKLVYWPEEPDSVYIVLHSDIHVNKYAISVTSFAKRHFSPYEISQTPEYYKFVSRYL